MKTSTLHYSQRNQEQIMDLSLKDNNVSNQKPIFTPCQKELSYVSKYHDHSFMQEHAYLESLFSTSLRNKQEMSNITRYRSKNSSTGLGPFENQQLCDVANPIPQFTFAEPKPTSLPPTPRIPDDGNPNNFPFSSPNLRNTLKSLPLFRNIAILFEHFQPELSIKSDF
ncbi:unnamed protein product [Ceratitis capitata]|uniref:(Mediterranean fruit fly) hypothetical protein n=1 Tax=Ceratitis capitata TaxID=7213 RepID=A0A811V672_CERCA|nr:unnamed protein product [Ceratitis capitata]